METAVRHRCLIYDGAPSGKLPLLAALIKGKLEEGYRCLYLNSLPMVAGIGSVLASIGIDVVKEIESGSLVLSSEPVLVEGQFDIDSMLAKLEGAIDQALKDGYKGLWASGDMTWEFGAHSNFSKLMEYELRLDNLFHQRKELHGVCQYHIDTLPKNVLREGLVAHNEVIISETVCKVNPDYLKHTWPLDKATSQVLNHKISEIAASGNTNAS